MPSTRVVTVFKFEELTDQAKEKAREWFREGALDYEWWDCVYEDAAQVADRLGIDLRQKVVKLMRGGTRYDPCIFFSGFYSQGDGACWEGSYSYRKGSVKAVKAYAPQDQELHRIAESLFDIQRRHFYKVTASCKHTGHYNHSGCMEVNVEDGRDCWAAPEVCDDVTRLLRDFADWVYGQLKKEHDWRMSDECVDEEIQANEYDFGEDGNRI